MTYEQIQSSLNQAKDIEALKKIYRELIFTYHPDRGGDEETSKFINSIFEKLIIEFAGNSFRKRKSESEHFDFDDDDVYDFADIIKKVINLDGITIEIIGTWLYAWNSKPHKDYLKSIGFWFSGKHKAWIYNGEAKRTRKRSRANIDSIRNVYGSRIVEKEENEKLKIATA